MNRKINLTTGKALPLDNADVYAAMQELGAYLDITPEDFREVYAHAHTIARRRLLQGITARDIMSSPALTMMCKMTLCEAVAFLDDKGISGAPVVNEQGHLVGVLSETDIAKAVGDSGHQGAFTPMSLLRTLLRKEYHFKGLDATVEMFMTSKVIVTSPESTLSELLSLLQAHTINRLPILDGDSLVGIVSRTDIINAFGTMS